jgi:hypothetical protein
MALALVAFPALASAGCPDQPTSKIFSIFGDNQYYSEVPNGDFDGSTYGWMLDNAKTEGTDSLTRRNAPYLTQDGKSLKLDRQSYAVSPPICVSERHPSFRFFARKKGRGNGDLSVRLLYTTTGGDMNLVRVGTLDSDAYDAWGLSPSLPLWSALPLQGQETAQIRLVFDYGYLDNGAPESGVRNQWRIDEVYVDPYRR